MSIIIIFLRNGFSFPKRRARTQTLPKRKVPPETRKSPGDSTHREAPQAVELFFEGANPLFSLAPGLRFGGGSFLGLAPRLRLLFLAEQRSAGDGIGQTELRSVGPKDDTAGLAEQGAVRIRLDLAIPTAGDVDAGGLG